MKRPILIGALSLLTFFAGLPARAENACGLVDMLDVFEALPAVAQRFPEAREIAGESFRQLAVSGVTHDGDGQRLAALLDTRDGRVWLLRHGDGAFHWFGPVLVNDGAFLAGCPRAPLPADYQRPRDIAAFEILNLEENPSPAPSSGDAAPR